MCASFWTSSHCLRWQRGQSSTLPAALQMRAARNTLTSSSAARAMSTTAAGITDEDMTSLRIAGAEFIKSLATDLPCPVQQEQQATAIVYFIRFWESERLEDVSPYLLCVACLFLAVKTEELFATNTSAYSGLQLLRHAHALMARIDATEPPYTEDHLLTMEFLLMEALQSDLRVFHPYEYLEAYLGDARLPNDRIGTVWHIVNDSYRTDACLRFPPHIIALGCIHVMAVLNQLDIRAWLSTLAVPLDEVWRFSDSLLSLYEHWKQDTVLTLPELIKKYGAKWK